MAAGETVRALSSSLVQWSVNPSTVMAGGLAGLVGGMVAGAMARIAMRVVAIIAGERPEFSVMGTIGILIIFALLGLIAVFPYLMVRRWLPGRYPTKGLLYGVVLAMLICIPFFRTSEGELGIVSPVIGAALFAPIGVVYGVVVVGLLERVEHRFVRVQPVAGWWFGLFSLAFVFALVRMIAGSDRYIRTPGAVQRLYLALGVEYGAIQEMHSIIAVLFALSYCALCATLFARGLRSRPAQGVAIGLLLFGGLILPGGTLLLGMLDTSAGGHSEWLVWALAMLTLLGATGVLYRRFGRLSIPIEPPTSVWLASGIGLALVAFLLMWATVLLIPGLQLRRVSAFHTMFVVPLYLWPWLLCPLALLATGKRARKL